MNEKNNESIIPISNDPKLNSETRDNSTIDISQQRKRQEAEKSFRDKYIERLGPDGIFRFDFKNSSGDDIRIVIRPDEKGEFFKYNYINVSTEKRENPNFSTLIENDRELPTNYYRDRISSMAPFTQIEHVLRSLARIPK